MQPRIKRKLNALLNKTKTKNQKLQKLPLKTYTKHNHTKTEQVSDAK